MRPREAGGWNDAPRTRRQRGGLPAPYESTPSGWSNSLSGWSEVQTTIRFWVVGLLGALVGLALALEVY